MAFCAYKSKISIILRLAFMSVIKRERLSLTACFSLETWPVFLGVLGCARCCRRLSPSSGDDGALQHFIQLLQKHEGEEIKMTLASPLVLGDFRSAWKAAQSAEMSHSDRKANP